MNNKNTGIMCTTILIVFEIMCGSIYITPSPRFNNRVNAARKRIIEFKNQLFEYKDYINAMKYFSSKSYTNTQILTAECLGKLGEFNHESEESIKNGILKFITKFSRLSNNDPFVLKKMNQIVRENRNYLHNDPCTDGFYICIMPVKNATDFLAVSSKYKYFKNNLHQTDFSVCLIPTGGGFIFCLWIEESGEWNIYDIDMICN